MSNIRHALNIKREDDFAAWYQEVISAADMAEQDAGREQVARSGGVHCGDVGNGWGMDDLDAAGQPVVYCRRNIRDNWLGRQLKRLRFALDVLLRE